MHSAGNMPQALGPGKPKEGECGRPNQPGKKVVTYTFDGNGSIFGWNAKYVVLCPRFFDDDILTLQQIAEKAKSNDTLKTTIDDWRKTKARSLFHETYHWGTAEVSDPRCDRSPEVYDAGKVADLAKKENTGGSKTNAESWALAAVAIYMQQTFNLKDPPKPKSMTMAGADGIEDMHVVDAYLGQAPGWLESPVPVNASSFSQT